MLLSLVAWIGGLIFFAFVLAPTIFAPGVLPNTHLAGNIVGRALGKLHWIAIVSGIVFLASSLLYSRLTAGTAHVFAVRHVLICGMLGLTLLSQFWIIPRMDTLRMVVHHPDGLHEGVADGGADKAEAALLESRLIASASGVCAGAARRFSGDCASACRRRRTRCSGRRCRALSGPGERPRALATVAAIFSRLRMMPGFFISAAMLPFIVARDFFGVEMAKASR
jgi:hypothetical protein